MHWQPQVPIRGLEATCWRPLEAPPVTDLALLLGPRLCLHVTPQLAVQQPVLGGLLVPADAQFAAWRGV